MKKYFPESTILIIVGIITGVFVEYVPFKNETQVKSLLQVDPDLYLLLFIPLIIFDATYFLNQSVFFANFFEISIYAVIGTITNAVVITVLLSVSAPLFSLHYDISHIMAYSSLLSAIDPVAVISIME